MNIKTGDIIKGFRLVNAEPIDDIKSEGYLFEHIKSGARLMYIENDDDNKVFFISFKTPPTLLTENITRPPVEASNISRIFSLILQH